MSHPPTFPRGGVRLPDRKDPAASLPIRKAFVPSEALIPLRQSVQPAECLVREGQAVQEGTLIGRACGPLSANVHASIPGVVKELRWVTLPDGEPSLAAVIALEGEFRLTGRPQSPGNWRQWGREQLLGMLEACGVVDPEGIPAATRLRQAGRPEVLVANGVESEPDLSCGERLMVERPEEVLEGARIAAAAVGAASLVAGVTADRQEALRSMGRAAAAVGGGVRLVELEPRYPQQEERLMAFSAAGRRVPRSARPEDVGVLVLDIGTLAAIREAVVLGMPVLERVVTVAGEGVARPANLKARLGISAGELLEECGGTTGGVRLVAGGPLRGFALGGPEAPLTKDMAGLLALAGRGIRTAAQGSCIGCGRCIEACPWGLRPAELYKWLDREEPLEAWARGLGECRECGCCAYVCPSRLPLLQGLRSGRKAGVPG
jgi:electron transport complex protein RnfC